MLEVPQKRFLFTGSCGDRYKFMGIGPFVVSTVIIHFTVYSLLF